MFTVISASDVTGILSSNTVVRRLLSGACFPGSCFNLVLTLLLQVWRLD